MIEDLGLYQVGSWNQEATQRENFQKTRNKSTQQQETARSQVCLVPLPLQDNVLSVIPQLIAFSCLLCRKPKLKYNPIYLLLLLHNSPIGTSLYNQNDFLRAN